jgi:hypothetical protein
MAKKGSTANLRRFNKELQAIPTKVAIEVAKRAAGKLTALMQSDFDSGRTAYSETRKKGAYGNDLDLVDNSTTRGALHFTSDGGTKIRVAGLPDYARFLIGKYKILPIGNAALPYKWNHMLRWLGSEVIAELVEDAAS